MGAWIEIRGSGGVSCANAVAPYMGAWIEINKTTGKKTEVKSRTLHGCVD